MAIAGAAGMAGGVVNGIVLHPIDTLQRQMQVLNKGNPEHLKIKPKMLDYLKTYGQADKWEGVGASSVKKGLGFGVVLGTSFAADQVLRKYLAKGETKLSSLGIHKA